MVFALLTFEVSSDNSFLSGWIQLWNNLSQNLCIFVSSTDSSTSWNLETDLWFLSVLYTDLSLKGIQTHYDLYKHTQCKVLCSQYVCWYITSGDFVELELCDTSFFEALSGSENCWKRLWHPDSIFNRHQW